MKKRYNLKTYAAICTAPNLIVTNKLGLNFLSDLQNILWNAFNLEKKSNHVMLRCNQFAFIK
jgi:hypothetical protein